MVMRNTRQFVNGMKNYLVKHGEGDFHRVVDNERDKVRTRAPVTAISGVGSGGGEGKTHIETSQGKSGKS